jgi:DNA phosphorothioation-dependent restriction protein DptG
MSGDCEDVAILFAYIAHTQFFENPIMIEEHRDIVWHCYIEIDGEDFFDHLSSGWNDTRSWTYGELMWIATHSHGITPFGKSIE